MKKISFVLLVVLVAFLIKFSYENLTQGAFVLKYESKTNEKQVSFLIETGQACKHPAAADVESAPKEVAQVEQENEFERAFLNYDFNGVDAELDFTVSEWLLSDFEYSKYEEAPDAEVEFASAQVDVRKKELEVEVTLDHDVETKETLIAGSGEGEPSGIALEENELPSWACTPEQELCEITKCPQSCWDFLPKRLTIRHVIGEQGNDCIPFASNFTTYEAFFAPEYRLGHIMPFLDVRGHRFDNNTYAANVGIGGRYIPNPRCDCFCEMLGFNAYYDYRQGCIGYYNQIGLGIEILSCGWDFRANAYVPFGKRRHIKQCVFDDYDGDYYAWRKDIESISYSFNAEIGYLALRSECFLLYVAAGPYFLARGLCSGYAAGGEVRIRPQYRDYFAVDLSWRHDSLFETIWQLEVIVNLPLYQLKCANRYPCGISDRQIYQPVGRFEVMPLRKKRCWNFNW